jgi:hypothetical protein
MNQAQLLVIGAGPYGLSIAALRVSVFKMVEYLLRGNRQYGRRWTRTPLIGSMGSPWPCRYQPAVRIRTGHMPGNIGEPPPSAFTPAAGGAERNLESSFWAVLRTPPTDLHPDAARRADQGCQPPAPSTGLSSCA